MQGAPCCPRVPAAWRAALVAAALLLAGHDAFGDHVSAQRGAPALADPADLAVGRLLVARRGLGDGNFGESVVLLFAYATRDGAAGLIINRRSTVPTSRVLPELPTPRGSETMLFLGGPVSPEAVFGLLRSARPQSASVRVLPDVALVTTANGLDAAVDEGATADHLRIFRGYSGWSPGQLEREVLRGDWYITRGASHWVFDTDPAQVWRRILRTVDVLSM